MLDGISDGILTAAIGHEMAHIARRDFVCNLLYEAAALPLWFHPATLWLRREIDRTRELACDELVTGQLLEPGAYAESIVSIAAEISGLGRPGYTLGVLDGDILEDRIQRLLHRPAANLKRARLTLAAGLGALAVCAVAASSLAISARAQSAAQPEMKLAGQSYNTGDFAGAVSHFEKAVSLDPGNTNARLFLANAYLRQYRANSRAEGAAELLDKAREQYREAATRDPRNVPAMIGLASMLGTDHAEEARQWMLKAIEADPKNKNAYYTAGVADWQMAYALLRNSGTAPGPAMYDEIADPGARARLASQMLPIIEDGLRMLQIGLDLDPQSSDAMAYMNLLVRLRAPLVNTAAEHSKLIAQADDWVRKALEARKGHGSDTAGPIDVDQPAPQAIPAMVPAPPPPPPPPPGGFRGNRDKAH
jgi:Tfp pilus assembly protein PilF